MIAAALIILAAICKSIADTLQHHFETSRFRKLDEKWWNPLKSWAYVKFIPLTKYRPDAWHLLNSGMIVSFIVAIVLHQPVWPWYVEIAIGGLLFNIVFEVLYSKVWRHGK